MSYILLLEENLGLAKMYKSVLENSGFKVVHFASYKELYKKLDGEGFTAVILDSGVQGRTLDFISKVRKTSGKQIPIFVATNQNVDTDIYKVFGNITCFPRFPNSGGSLAEFTKTLSSRTQFKNILQKKHAT